MVLNGAGALRPPQAEHAGDQGEHTVLVRDRIGQTRQLVEGERRTGAGGTCRTGGVWLTRVPPAGGSGAYLVIGSSWFVPSPVRGRGGDVSARHHDLDISEGPAQIGSLTERYDGAKFPCCLGALRERLNPGQEGSQARVDA